MNDVRDAPWIEAATEGIGHQRTIRGADRTGTLGLGVVY
jgi:hypothetical protein